MHWTALLPLTALEHAKSRLRSAALSPQAHAAVVQALREDTARGLAASALVRTVLVVSADPASLAWAERCGFATLAETAVLTPGGAAVHGLNPALVQAEAAARTRWPEAAVLAVVGDLPALTGPLVDALLAGFGTERGRGFVADRAGTGTTVLASIGLPLEPRFGVGSAQRHRHSGARALDAPLELRWDVDTVADLSELLPHLPADSATARAVQQARP